MGFSFNNKHSSDLNVISKSDNRTVSPSKRRNQYLIPGRDGLLDYGNETYENRIITMQLSFIKHNLQDLRLQVRSVAQWLSGKGNLIFDDEPDKAYQAKVFEAIDLEQLNTNGQCTVAFECLPFAESLIFNQVNTDTTQNNKEIKAIVGGTTEACCIITIKNKGISNITDINIRRKAAI